MKRYIILLMGILGFIPILAQQSEYYYYYKGNRIDLEVDSTHLYVVSEGEFQPQSRTNARASQYNVSHSSRSQIYNIVEPLQKQRSSLSEAACQYLPPGLLTAHHQGRLLFRFVAEHIQQRF